MLNKLKIQLSVFPGAGKQTSKGLLRTLFNEGGTRVVCSGYLQHLKG